jgi:hypothetical protein
VSELVVRHHASVSILTFGGPEVHTYVYSMYHAQISIDHRIFVYLQVFGFFRMLSAVSSYIYRVFGKLNPVVALQTQNPGLEREVRSEMTLDGTQSLSLYPEEREAHQPTTNKIIDIFDSVSTYSIIQDGQVVEEFKDDLTDTQRTILRYLNISESKFWRAP